MPDASPPIFATFDEACRWFIEGGELVAVEDQREGFLRGRAQFLSFQVPIGEMAVANEIAALQEQLADIEGLSLIPAELLHITVRGVGFQVIASPQQCDVLRQDVGGIGERAANALRNMKPIDVTIGPINVFPDALILQVEPIEPLRDVLQALEVTRHPDAFPYQAQNYLPHVTIASFLDTAVANALREHLPALRNQAPFSTTINRIHLARWWFTGHDLAAWPEIDKVRSYRLK